MSVENFLSPWEIEIYIESLKNTDLEDVGTKGWFENHKRLMLLNQQNVLEISSYREEKVKDWFILCLKIPVLIYEAIQIMIWKQKVYPLLIEMYGEPSNTFLMFSVFYHENLSISILENVLYHSDSIESMDDSIIDLIDYAVNYITMLLYANKENDEDNEYDEDDEENEDHTKIEKIDSCLKELSSKRVEIEFDIGIRCISVIRYLAEFADNLPLCALSRMLASNDVPYLLAQLMELQPWKKRDKTGEFMIYDGNKWRKMETNDFNKVSKCEGQVWFGLRELLLNPKCAPYYEITEVRMGQLQKLQKYMHEHVLDQIAPLIELRRWLGYLTMSSQTSNSQRPISVEVIPQINKSIIEKYKKKWKRLAEHQEKTLFSKDIEHIKSMAQILSEAYDFDKIEVLDSKKCNYCKDVAKNRCSRCKEIWYCGRECQVKDWKIHKSICENILKSQQDQPESDEED